MAKRRGQGALLDRADTVHMYGLVTMAQAAERLETSYHGLRMWLRYHPEIPLLKLGTIVLLRVDELEKIRPVLEREPEHYQAV